MAETSQTAPEAKPAEKQAAKPARSAAPRARVPHTARPGARLALYDFGAELNARGGRQRRMSRIETQGENEILHPTLRLRGIDLARDMLRNNPQFRGMARTMRANIVGDYGKLRFRESGGWYKTAQTWFNSRWARHADFIDGSTWRECLQLAAVAVETEGDFVAVFDDGILTGDESHPHGTGRLRFFEGDQICNLDDASFGEYSARGWTQNSGVLYDQHGRVVGVVVTSRRGLSCVPAADAFVLTRDPDADADPNWVLVLRKFRLAQTRGSASAIPALQTIIDSYEMLGYELLTAKQGASRYALVTMPQGDSGVPIPAGFDDVDAGQSADGGTDGSGQSADAAANADGDAGADNCDDFHADALEEWSGANTDYAPFGTQITFDPTNRPNANMPGFLDYTTDVAGSALGMGHAYSRLRADTSYTAFRGDMVMTWMSFRDFQQFLEDSFSDWVARCAIRHGMETGAIPSTAPEGWEDGIAWQYPRMPSVDEQKEQAALQLKLKNGLTTFRDILGPSWREQLAQFAEEIDFARKLNLPLSVLEALPGGSGAAQPTQETEDNG